jgi:hypothetical protein
MAYKITIIECATLEEANAITKRDSGYTETSKASSKSDDSENSLLLYGQTEESEKAKDAELSAILEAKEKEIIAIRGELMTLAGETKRTNDLCRCGLCGDVVPWFNFHGIRFKNLNHSPRTENDPGNGDTEPPFFNGCGCAKHPREMEYS